MQMRVIERLSTLTLAGVLVALGGCGSGAADRVGPPRAGSDAQTGCSGATCDAGGPPAAPEAGDDGAPEASVGSGAVEGGPSGSLPALTVVGNHLQDPTGKTIVLRGSSLIDIGALYTYGGQGAGGIVARIDEVASAGVQGHVVRMPVYPEIDYNGGHPTCSPLPYPVGTGPSTTCTPKMPLSASDYVAKVLTPAVDYATSKNLYVIIDFHQIDNATTGTSAADATTFWTDIAPRFAAYRNVLYEVFNEPIDAAVSWAALKPVVQGWVDTVRASAPDNLIVVPSNDWDQHGGDAASDPPRGTNLVYTAHIYVNNWNQAFQAQVALAVKAAPVFISEWGYTGADATSHAWGTALQTLVEADGASWTAWVTDNAWSPNMFADTSLSQLTDFGGLVQSWLSADANRDWVQ
jgi:hypothetical protein